MTTVNNSRNQFWPRPSLKDPVSILIPVCNEEGSIESLIAEVVVTLYRHLPEGSEIIIQEGGSNDKTKEILRDLYKRWPFLKIEFNDEKEGFVEVTKSLFNKANCPLVFFLDSDGQCIPSEFWELIPNATNFDFVLGKKSIRYDPLPRQILSRVFNIIARVLFGFSFTDINFGFRLMKIEVLHECLTQVNTMPLMINAEIVIIANMKNKKMIEVPVKHRPRLYGEVKGFDLRKIHLEVFQAFIGLIKLKNRFKYIS